MLVLEGPLKMAIHPCIANRLPKNCVFHQPANQRPAASIKACSQTRLLNFRAEPEPDTKKLVAADTTVRIAF